MALKKDTTLKDMALEILKQAVRKRATGSIDEKFYNDLVDFVGEVLPIEELNILASQLKKDISGDE